MPFNSLQKRKQLTMSSNIAKATATNSKCLSTDLPTYINTIAAVDGSTSGLPDQSDAILQQSSVT